MPMSQVMQRFVDDELAPMPALIERVVAGALQLLRDSKGGPLSAAERGQQFAIVEALQAHTAAYQRAFVESLRSGVQSVLDEHREGASAGSRSGGSGLELMDESRVDVDIEISRAMQLIDTTAEWELRELQTFTSTMLGQTYVSAESNPFQPLVCATALWDAACVVSPLQAHRAPLLRVSAGVAAGLLKKSWAAACTRLESQGVEPSIYRTVLLAPGTTLPRTTDAAESDKHSAMSTLLRRMPGGAAASASSAASAGVDVSAFGVHGRAPSSSFGALGPEFDQALARLDELVRHMPTSGGVARESTNELIKRVHVHRAALIASATAPFDRQVIELLSRIFDTVLSDPLVPPPFVAVLARVQASALRVALRDPQLLESARHPVWQWLDRVGEAGAGYPQGTDPRSIALATFCTELTEQLGRAPAPDASLFRRALGELDAFLETRLQEQIRAAQPSIQALQQAERREVLEERLAQRVVEQMTHTHVSIGVRRFLTDAWAKVIAHAMLTFGEPAEATRGYVKLVDELLWSVQLPDHPQSRQRLVAMLPGMLQRLRAGMASINLPAGEQDAFLDELVAIHAEALRPGRVDPAAALTSEQLVQRMRDEVLPPASGHGGFSDSLIDLGSMETVPAELMQGDSVPASPSRRIDALREGDRLRIFLKGRWSRVQMLWRSEQGHFMLFAGEAAGRNHSITHRALERLGQAGLVQPHEGRSLVQRALESLTQEVSTTP